MTSECANAEELVFDAINQNTLRPEVKEKAYHTVSWKGVGSLGRGSKYKSPEEEQRELSRLERQ